MKRDVRIPGLSSDHHHALVLARTMRMAFEARTADSVLARRTREEHATLCQLVESAHQGDRDALRAFGVLLNAHVRFEESELFPTCEQRLDEDVLDAVADRAPKHPYPR